jgi:phosphate transport system permease protein
MVGAGSLIIAVPLGVACAAYLAEIASSKEKEIFKPIIEILAGIPSVILGFFGLVVLAPLISRLFNVSTDNYCYPQHAAGCPYLRYDRLFSAR